MKALSTTWRNIRRSPYQAVAAIFVMMLTFLAFSIFALIIFGSTRIVDYFESKPQVTAFFRDEAKQADIEDLGNSLKESGLISEVKFVSKEEALRIYKEQNKDDPLLLDLVTAEILPASLEIATYNIEDLALVSDTLKKSTIVQEVVFQKDVVSTLSSWTSALRKIGLAVVIILSMVSIFIMVTIIGIKISQKKSDIETMRLIGAGSWYIRWPFILEGIFYGLIGALIGWLISIGALFYVTPYLSSFLKGIPVLPISPIFLLELLAVEAVVAIILGAFSSYLAVLRYLK
ncbi:MAG: permease-like cell division protein FtsX [Candidatus Levybacteria bacterium]|nr:permease-like cell division protein FtsX [Candidatus Levybacteria bacterium]